MWLAGKRLPNGATEVGSPSGGSMIKAALSDPTGVVINVTSAVTTIQVLAPNIHPGLSSQRPN